MFGSYQIYRAFLLNSIKNDIYDILFNTKKKLAHETSDVRRTMDHTRRFNETLGATKCIPVCNYKKS
jgi:hypothetical protein